MKNIKIKLLTLFLILASLTQLAAQSTTNYSTAQDGNWNDKSTWTSNKVPKAKNGDEITINHKITIDQNQGNSGFKNQATIINNGKLTIKHAATNQPQGEIENYGDIITEGCFTNHNIVLNKDTGDITIDGSFTNQPNATIENTGNSIIIKGALDNQPNATIENESFFHIEGAANNKGKITTNGTTLIDGSFANHGNVTGNGDLCSSDNDDPTNGNFSNIDPNVSICNQDQSTLPVELVEFQAKKTNQGIKLTWATATEINNDYFTVQRAVNNNKFEDIARIEGAGNSNEIINYSYTDNDKFSSKNIYYRIKQTDFDGSTSFSWIQDITSDEQMILDVFPNPVKQGENVSIQSSEENIRISIYNSSGQQVYSKEANNNQIDIDSYNLKKGLYVIQIENLKTRSKQTEKLIIQ